MSTTLDDRAIEAGDAAATAVPRLEGVLKKIKLELVSVRVGGPERARGFNPYDGRPAHSSRDPWSRRRRA